MVPRSCTSQHGFYVSSGTICPAKVFHLCPYFCSSVVSVAHCCGGGIAFINGVRGARGCREVCVQGLWRPHFGSRVVSIRQSNIPMARAWGFWPIGSCGLFGCRWGWGCTLSVSVLCGASGRGLNVFSVSEGREGHGPHIMSGGHRQGGCCDCTSAARLRVCSGGPGGPHDTCAVRFSVSSY